MNCDLCHKEFDAWHKDRLTPAVRDQVEYHLKTCSECNEFYKAQILIDRVIAGEKELQVNPYLSARVMSEIENRQAEGRVYFPRILRPVLITVSMAAAIFLGVMMGSIPQRNLNGNELPIELALINDAGLESIDILLNE
jgi:predicted anti-sigma-YlaC factor YlaD